MLVLLDSLLIEAADEVSEEVEILLLNPESLDLALVEIALSTPFTTVVVHVVSSSLEIVEDTSASASIEASEIVEAPCGSLVETAAVAVAFALEVLAAAAEARGEGGSIFIFVEERTVSAGITNTLCSRNFQNVKLKLHFVEI